jgi:hypothetical protein
LLFLCDVLDICETVRPIPAFPLVCHSNFHLLLRQCRLSVDLLFNNSQSNVTPTPQQPQQSSSYIANNDQQPTKKDSQLDNHSNFDHGRPFICTPGGTSPGVPRAANLCLLLTQFQL